MGVLGAGWLVWLYNVVRYRGLARTTRGLIAQNTRLIEANESLRWQNSSLLGERAYRIRADARARDRDLDLVIDLTDVGDVSVPDDESTDAGSTGAES
jgi:hypothetical protein